MSAIQIKRGLVTAFNNALRKFVNCVEQLHASDAEVIKVRNSVFAALSASEMVAMEAMGPYLFRYREPIVRGDIDFFMAQDFSEAGDFVSLVRKAKDTLSRITADERAVILKLVQDMTVIYIKFVLAEKSS